MGGTNINSNVTNISGNVFNGSINIICETKLTDTKIKQDIKIKKNKIVKNKIKKMK